MTDEEIDKAIKEHMHVLKDTVGYAECADRRTHKDAYELGAKMAMRRLFRGVIDSLRRDIQRITDDRDRLQTVLDKMNEALTTLQQNARS